MVTPQERELPVIDLSQPCAEAICWAAKEYEFFLVVNHGISSELLKKMTREQMKLFDNSSRTSSPAQFSWPEAFHFLFTKIYDPSFYGQFTSLRVERSDDGVRPHHVLANQDAVGSPSRESQASDHSKFNKICHESTCFLQLNHYPVCPLSPETFWPVPHADVDFLTIFYPDQVRGIRLRKDSRWVVVKPIRAALIASIGDLLQAWSNDVYRSVERKVETNSEVERYSVAFSLCPSCDSQIGSCRSPPSTESSLMMNTGSKFKRTSKEPATKLVSHVSG